MCKKDLLYKTQEVDIKLVLTKLKEIKKSRKVCRGEENGRVLTLATHFGAIRLPGFIGLIYSLYALLSSETAKFRRSQVSSNIN